MLDCKPSDMDRLPSNAPCKIPFPCCNRKALYEACSAVFSVAGDNPESDLLGDRRFGSRRIIRHAEKYQAHYR